MKGFVKLQAKSQSGDLYTQIALDHIGVILEARVGSQIICKNGDTVPLKDKIAVVEKAIEEAQAELAGKPNFKA